MSHLDSEFALTPLDAQVSAIEGVPVMPYSTDAVLAMGLVLRHKINLYWRKIDNMCVAYLTTVGAPSAEAADPLVAICKALVAAKRAGS